MNPRARIGFRVDMYRAVSSWILPRMLIKPSPRLFQFGAVIGAEDHDGLFGFTDILKMLENFADGLKVHELTIEL